MSKSNKDSNNTNAKSGESRVYTQAKCCLCKNNFKAFGCAKETGLGICDDCFWMKVVKKNPVTGEKL